jgi:hypothetical protein
MTLQTIGLSSWNVDLATVGAIYPFQGTEFILAIVGIAFWIVWHIWQIGHENREISSKLGHVNGEKAKRAIDRY